jgi:hypothetical protein
MSQEKRQIEVEARTRQLLQGPLKHVRRAALAAALLPLASVAATPAAAETGLCPSGGTCGTVSGFVWNDVNENGIQDSGEPGIENAVVSLEDGAIVTFTGPDGSYSFSLLPGTYTLAVQIPPGTQPSPSDLGGDDTIDSDGVPDGLGNSVVPSLAVVEGQTLTVDFGFFNTPVVQPGTGTPGYWKNHPEAWPVDTITVGGVTYTREEAIAWLEKSGKDRTLTMFSSLVPAMLNVLIGNDDDCVSSTIDAANTWMSTHGPVGSGVAASSYAWKVGEPLHRLMDNYNNGGLCAPPRD